jgi:hypothetical protein
VALATGGSLGGMVALEWARSTRARVDRLVVFAAPAATSAQAIAWNAAQRMAIEADPAWQGGRYFPGRGPAAGLAAARALAMITYRSAREFQARFGRGQTRVPDTYDVEHYLRRQGDKLVARFDAASYMSLMRSMDLHDVGPLDEAARATAPRVREVVGVGVDSDILYAAAEVRAWVAAYGAHLGQLGDHLALRPRRLPHRGRPGRRHPSGVTYRLRDRINRGRFALLAHDAFLIEFEPLVLADRSWASPRNTSSHAFLLSLIRDPRFQTVVDDIVIECGNALHQDVADRFVRGEDVPSETLQKRLDTTGRPSESLWPPEPRGCSALFAGECIAESWRRSTPAWRSPYPVGGGPVKAERRQMDRNGVGRPSAEVCVQARGVGRAAGLWRKPVSGGGAVHERRVRARFTWGRERHGATRRYLPRCARIIRTWQCAGGVWHWPSGRAITSTTIAGRSGHRGAGSENSDHLLSEFRLRRAEHTYSGTRVIGFQLPACRGWLAPR